jgi:hypothetical protein
VPDVTPFDRDECWFETFVGHHLLPIIRNHPIQRFWFSRYGARGSFNVKFRFEIADYAPIQPSIDALINQFGLADDGFTDYDFAEDIGHGEGSRFLGSTSHGDKHRRGEKAFTFLHATAELFLDCLAGPENGYFFRERETQSGFNLETSLEQYHHLFCNLTDTPTFVVVGQHPQAPGLHVMAPGQLAQLQKADARWTVAHTAKVQY